MLGLKADQEVLGELVRARIPAVWRLMQDHGVMWSLVVSRWFICLFIDVLPVEVTERLRSVTWPGGSAMTPVFVLPSDGAADLGLSVLRGLQDPVPRGSDSDPPPSGPDSAGAEPAGRLRELQAHHQRRLCGGLPRVHAGEARSFTVSALVNAAIPTQRVSLFPGHLPGARESLQGHRVEAARELPRADPRRRILTSTFPLLVCRRSLRSVH